MKKLTLLIIALNCMAYIVNAQDPQWIVYDTSNSNLPYHSVSSIAIDEEGVKWIGAINTLGWEYVAASSLVAFNNDDWIIYDTLNSDLPTGCIRSIVIDGNSNKWIGLYPEYATNQEGGLAAFDGTNWLVFNTSNSDLPSNHIRALAIDENSTIWIGTRYGGLAAFDGTNWLVYNTTNSDLPSNDVLSIAIDGNGIKWIGTDNGLATFDGTNWVVYNTSNSDLPSNLVLCLAIDQNETKWMACEATLVSFDGNTWTSYSPPVMGNWIHMVGTEETEENGRIWISKSISPLPPGGSGLTSFDGVDWITYKSNDSGLPDNYVFSIVTDQNGTKWIGTRDRGLAAFNENGVPNNVIETTSKLINVNIYPNPATDKIHITINNVFKFETINIYNQLGQNVLHINEIRELIDISELGQGIYIIELNSNELKFRQKLIIK